jgi:hypothetical protein
MTIQEIIEYQLNLINFSFSGTLSKSVCQAFHKSGNKHYYNISNQKEEANTRVSEYETLLQLKNILP